jgi:ABC-2 type transport system permease protein
MSDSVTGADVLTRFALRRDRIMLPAWVYIVVIEVAVNAATFAKLYKTAAQRASLVTTGRDNPALIFLYGRLYGDSVGGLTFWRIGVWACLFAALMTIFLVIRHTRADEESGRLELVGSARVGRHAPLVSALTVAVIANVVVAVLLALVLPLLKLPVAGSVAFALVVGTCGLAFAGVSAVAAQLTSSARAGRGIAICVLGAAFLVRAVGDAAGATGPNWLTWLLPLGWAELVRPFAGERWWILVLPLAVFVIGTAAAFWLAARRDLGAGLLADRPGRPGASALLRGPLTLAWRLQWSSLAAWAAGYAILFAVCGAAADGIGKLVGTSGALRTEFTRLGGQPGIVNAYLAGLMLLAGLGAAGYGVMAVLRLRTEESGNLADPVLAGSVARVRWGLSHLLVAVVGMAVLLVIAGVATGLGYGVRAGGVGPQVASLFGAALGELPAALVIAAVAACAFGAAPRACVAVGWTALGLAVALNLFGAALQLSHWALDVSPFTHAPRLPGGTVSAAPLLWLCFIAVALCGTGLVTLRRRDVG